MGIEELQKETPPRPIGHSDRPTMPHRNHGTEEQGGEPRSDRKVLFKRFLSWVTKGGLAVVDYGLISGSNFVLGVLLARWLSQREYGAYALVFSFFILVGFLYQCLLLEPLSVFSGTLFHDNLRGYLKTSLSIHWALSLVMCLLLGVASAVTLVIGHSPLLAISLAGMTIATPFILAHGLARRAFYLKLSPGPSAFGSVFYCAMVVGGVFLFFRLGWLTSFSAFLVMGMAACVSGIVMVFQLNALLAPATGHPLLRTTWGKHWEYGRWALGTCVVGWIPNYIYIPLVSSFRGMAAAGELRALMNLAGPVLQTYAALSMLFLPYASRVQSKEGTTGTYALTWRMTMLFTVGAIAYWAVVIPFRGPILKLLYAGNYGSVGEYLPFFALETIVWSASVGASIVLRAMEAPRYIFYANCVASVITLAVGIPATKLFGLWGVVWSIILANSAALIMVIVLLRRKAAESRAANLDFPASLPVEEQI